MERYKYYQPNDMDLKDEYYDDPIRALSKVFEISWLEVFDSIIPLARSMQCSFLEKKCYEKYLSDCGLVYTGISNKKGSVRPTVREFAEEHKKGRYFVTVANHTVAVVDGFYYNTWDCGHKSMYGYWCLPEDKQLRRVNR